MREREDACRRGACEVGLGSWSWWCDWHSDLAFLVFCVCVCVCVCERIMDGSFGRIVDMWVGGWVLVGVRWDDPMCYTLL